MPKRVLRVCLCVCVCVQMLLFFDLGSSNSSALTQFGFCLCADVEQAIAKKVLFWLSRENLQTDTYLVSHMNADMWVDIEVLTHFKGLKALNADAALVAKVMRSSDRVVVSEDGKTIKPSFKLERRTLILRDIASSTDTKVCICHHVPRLFLFYQSSAVLWLQT